MTNINSDLSAITRSEFNLDWLLEYILQYWFGMTKEMSVSHAATFITVSGYIVTFVSLLGTYYLLYNDNKNAFHVWMYTNSAMLLLNVFVRAHNYAMGIFFLVNLFIAIKGYNDSVKAEKKEHKI